MDWLQLTLRTGIEGLDALEQAMLNTGALAVTYRDAEDQPVLEPGPGEMPLWGQLLVTALYAQGSDPQVIAARLCQQLSWSRLPSDAFEDLPDRHWERAWLDDFHPMSFGDRLWIVPHAFEPPRPDAVNLRLDPGLAFGTGTHPTTQLCLEWLDSADLSGLTIIDYGCGSGVLAIAALLLGADRAIATDIDPQALTATRENARINGVDERMTTCLPEAMPELSADVVMANILAGPLHELAPRMAELTLPGGALVLSGLLSEQAELLAEHYRQWFDVDAPALSGDWARLTAKRDAIGRDS